MPICLLQSMVKETEKPAKLKIVTIWPFTGQEKVLPTDLENGR